MKCLACDVILTDREATKKFPSGNFVDLCDDCSKYLPEDVVLFENLELDDEENVEIGDK